MKDKTKEITMFLYNHQLVRYIFVGGTTFFIDIVILYILHQGLKFNIEISTATAYVLSIIYNFILNRQWTFSTREKESLKKHMAAYGLLLSFNGLFTVVSVSLMSHVIYFGLAKIITVAIQVTWTFPIYKNVIFTKEGV